MLAIISPSKTQDFSPCDINSFTQTRQLDHTQELVNILKNKTQRQISKLMSLSEKLSKLNFDRFQAFKTPFSLDNAKQALLAFKGDVYNGINAPSLSVQDLDFAQKNVRMLSGLYGVLRPLDLIQPYRLEMGTKLSNTEGNNLYDYWGSGISEILNADEEKLILNLASNELQVFANNPDQEQAEDALPVDYQGESLQIGFNVGYLVDVMNALDEDQVKITLSNPNSRALIEAQNDNRCLYVVMPMRL